MEETEMARISVAVLSALVYLHGNLRIHRDLKSDNILLGSNGSIKLADFGVAAQLTEEVRPARCLRWWSQAGLPKGGGQ